MSVDFLASKTILSQADLYLSYNPEVVSLCSKVGEML